MSSRKWGPASQPKVGVSAGNGPRIAVVGTGVAALMCARSLAKKVQSSPGLHSARVSLCTSRGKLCTQMGPKNQTTPAPGKPFFDYGCQYFTASHPMFAEEVERWAALGCVQPLPEGQVGMISKNDGFKPVSGTKCWAGCGGMGPMLARLIEETVKEFQGIVENVSGFPDQSKAITGLAKTSSGWQLSMKGGQQLGPFDFVIGAFAQHCLTDPFLLSGGPATERMLNCLRRVESNQLIPMQVSFEGKDIPAKFTAAHVYGEPALGFVSNNSQKPQQNGAIGTPGAMHWTLLSTSQFAEEQFNTNNKNYKRVAEQEMLAAFAQILNIDCISDHRPQVNRLNHWEDGLPTNTPPNSKGCLFDVDQCLGWCGDFCVLPGIQGAALSGIAMAEVIEEFLHKKEIFDSSSLLPDDKSWIPMSQVAGQDDTLMDIGSFSAQLGLQSHTTHTNLVPSAIGGYNKEAHTGNAAKGKGKGNNGYTSKSNYQQSSKGGGKDRGKGKVYTKGKGKYY